VETYEIFGGVGRKIQPPGAYGRKPTLLKSHYNRYAGSTSQFALRCIASSLLLFPRRWCARNRVLTCECTSDESDEGGEQCRKTFREALNLSSKMDTYARHWREGRANSSLLSPLQRVYISICIVASFTNNIRVSSDGEGSSRSSCKRGARRRRIASGSSIRHPAAAFETRLFTANLQHPKCHTPLCRNQARSRR
jgi:hypothetical protein